MLAGPEGLAYTQDVSCIVDGYSGAIGIPISLGKFTPRQKEMVRFGWVMYVWTKNQVKPGALSGRIAQEYYNLFKERGYEKNFLYSGYRANGTAVRYPKGVRKLFGKIKIDSLT
jgi:hypothetical protein